MSCETFLNVFFLVGAVSFQDLRTVNGVVHETFKDACIALRLCEDDNQWRDCLDEAKQYARPRQIRNLFCKILVNCFPSKPQELYLRYKECMEEDFAYKRRHDTLAQGHTMEQLIRNDLLIELNDFFKDHGYTNKDFKIDMPDTTLQREVADTSTEVDPGAERFFEENLGKLN